MRKLQLINAALALRPITLLDIFCTHGVASLTYSTLPQYPNEVGAGRTVCPGQSSFSSLVITGTNPIASHSTTRCIHASRYVSAYQVPSPLALPADEWEARRFKRAQRSQAASTRRIRSCCTFEDLLNSLPSKGAAPELVVQAALQAPRVLEWPLTPGDRRRLFAVLEHLTQQCAMHMEEYDMSELAALLGVCARARYTPGELLVPLQHRLRADVRDNRIKDQAAAEHLAALFTHLAHIRPGSRLLWDAAAAAAESVVRFGDTADIARTLAALVKANMLEKPLCSRAMAAAQRTLRSAQPQDVALLMRSLARAGSSPPPELVERLTGHLEDRGREYDLACLAEVAGAVGELGLRKRDLHQQLAQLGAEAMWREVAVLRTPVVPGCMPPPSPSGRRTAGQPPPVTPHTVLRLVRGASSAHPPPPPLLQSAAALLMELLTRAAAAAPGAGGVLEPEDWQRVDVVAAMMGDAGLQEERQELLLQVSTLRKRMATESCEPRV